MNTPLENKKADTHFRGFFSLLSLFLLAFLPFFFLLVAIWSYFEVKEEEVLYKTKLTLERFIYSKREHLNEEYWISYLLNKFFTEDLNEEIRTEKGTRKRFLTPEAFLAHILKIREEHGNFFDFIYFSPTGEVIEKNFETSLTNEELTQAYLSGARRIPYFGDGRYMNIGGWQENALMEELLGSFCRLNTPSKLFHNGEYKLLRGDLLDSKPRYAYYRSHLGGLIALVSQEALKKHEGLRNFMRKSLEIEEVALGYYDLKTKDSFCNNPSLFAGEFNEANIELTIRGNLEKFNAGHLVLKKTSSDFVVYACAPKAHSALFKAIVFILASLLFVWLFKPLWHYLYSTLILQKSGEMKIKRKLAFLLTITIGLPFLALLVLFQEYNMSKRMTLVAEASSKVVSNLLSINQSFESFLEDNSRVLNTKFSILEKELKNKVMDKGTLLKVHEASKVMPGTKGLSLVASETRLMGTISGLYPYVGDNPENTKFDFDRAFTFTPNFRMHPIEERENRYFLFVCKKILSSLNNTEMPGFMSGTLEVFSEMLTRKKFSEVIYTIVRYSNRCSFQATFSSNDLSYYTLLSSNTPSIFDYIVAMVWRKEAVLKAFVEGFIEKRQRDPSNLKYYAYDSITGEMFPSNLQPEVAEILKSAFESAGSTPADNPDVVQMPDGEYLFNTIIPSDMGNFSFLVMYPVSEINRPIEAEKISFIFLAFIVIVFALAVVNLLSKSFLKPLDALTKGAWAINERDFEHRISYPGKNEFGEIAEIFNKMMVGLEEMAVAKVVQESLFPPNHFEQGKMKTFAKSVTMTDLGGDYLDVFQVDEEHAVMLLGDVAGHGVQAAITMAMAKAGILTFPDLRSDPAEMLKAIHGIIRDSKKERKVFMTFQYMYINTVTGKALYSNGGALTPVLMLNSSFSNKSLEMFTMPLGAGRKGRYTNMELELESGSCVIFYTDGIVESSNSVGELIGFEGFKQMCLEHYDPDPEVFYNNIFAAYKEWSPEASDDVTLLITTFDKC
ncbi:MAG: SpoIIE family protein phosphatase [Candidatus Riflebacteria bacterium]|nr:SpoIIE family protein phosphatase [Candidatus Riflebacteria bacterium]